MPVPLPITVLLAARNEAANLPRCLAALKNVERVILLDSRSTDTTAEISRQHGAEVVQFDYAGGYPKKRQWALETLRIETPWTFLLDADEFVPPPLWTEIGQAISAAKAPDAFLIRKGFHFMGRSFRFGGFSFAALLLFRTGRARFERLLDHDASGMDMEIHERVIVNGRIQQLRTPLVHEDFKGLDAYIRKHQQYAVWEAAVRHRFLTTGHFGAETIQPRLFGNAQERRRFLKKLIMRVPFEPAVWFLYHYVVRGGILEGRAGFTACRIRGDYIAEVRRNLKALISGPSQKSVCSPP